MRIIHNHQWNPFYVVIGLLLAVSLISIYCIKRENRVNEELIHAIKINNTTMALQALRQGADANTLDYSVSYSPKVNEVLEGKTHCTAIMVLLDRLTSPNSPITENTAILKSLLDYHANPNARWDDGTTPLMSASLNGFDESIEMLLTYGAEVNARTGSGLTSLHAAVVYDHASTVRILIDHGIDINSKDDSAETAVMWAVNFKATKCLYLLIQCGANINILNNSGLSPLDLALKMKSKELIQLLTQHHALRGKQILMH